MWASMDSFGVRARLAHRGPEPAPTAPAPTDEAIAWHLLSLPARVGLARGPEGMELTTELPLPPVRLVAQEYAGIEESTPGGFS